MVAYFSYLSLYFFFFNDTATTEIYTLSLHDALPISAAFATCTSTRRCRWSSRISARSEEHTSELQSRLHLVCRLLLEKNNDEQHFLVHRPHALPLPRGHRRAQPG